MANELRFSGSLRVSKGNLKEGRSDSFTFDMGGTKGPMPGYLVVTEDGVDIDFSGLDGVGACRFRNPGPTYTVVVGVWDDTNDVFFPVFQVQPGHGWTLDMATDLGEEYAGTGTGTTANQTTLRAKSLGGEGVLIVEGFER